MFQTVPLSIIRSFAPYTQQWYMSYNKPLLCVQWKTPDDGQRNCPKHVEFYSKNKFEFLRFIFGIKLYMFQTVPLSIIRSFAPYTQQWYTSYNKPLLCVQWKTPDDGQRNCPKHVEFYSKNKLEFLKFIFGIKLYMFRTVLLSVIRSTHGLRAVIKPVRYTPLLCVEWKTPDDGQRNCPKHVQFYSVNKFEKLVHLVGIIIRIYHDARSPERQVSCCVPQRRDCGSASDVSVLLY